MVRGGAESRRGHDNLCATERSRKAKPPADEFSQPPSRHSNPTHSLFPCAALTRTAREVRTELPDPLPFRAFSVSESLTTYLARDFE